MKIGEDTITCPICSEIYEDPVECINCHNNFCKKCVDKLKETSIRHNTSFDCPLCKEELKYQKNIQFEMFFNQMHFICSKCKTTIIGYNNYKQHVCKKYKCNICDLIFVNEEKFFEHIEDNKKHIKIINFYFNKNNENREKWKTLFHTEINDLKKEKEYELNYENFLKEDKKKNIKKEEEKKLLENNDETQIVAYNDSKEIHEFQNFLNIKNEENFDKIFKIYYYGNERFEKFQKSQIFLDACEIKKQKSSSKQSNSFKIPEKCKFSEKYNLYYCYKNSNLNCNCCKNHICQPGNCICKECMQTNLSYHGLKKYYLINKAGRACKYSYNSFHCHCKIKTKTQNDNGNVFIGINWCHYPSYPCEACDQVTKLMEIYLEPEIVQKLKELKNII